MDDSAQLVMNWRSVMMAMVITPILICGVVLFFRRVEARASRPLGAVLILAALSMGPQIIGYADAYAIWPWMTFFPLFSTDLWFGPLLIIHAHALTRGTSLGWRRYLLLPGAVQCLYYLGAFFLPGDSMFDHLGKWAFNNMVHGPYVEPVETLVGVALMLFAIIYLWRERATYLAFLENESSAARDYDPVWLRNIVVALVAATCLYAGLEIAQLSIDLTYNAAFPFQVLLMAILCWLGLDAAWRLTSPFPKLRPSLATTAPVPDNLSERILSRMSAERWFLEPRLSIRDVANRMGSNESYVSRALNRASGQSFNQLVNGLRVKHAKIQLSDTSDPVLSIAMDSGFNSKATFNRVFRDFTGQTPSRFRASQNP